MEGPLRNQAASDRKTIPNQATIVFGHTHKPFVQAMNFAGFPGQTAVFNTGGWVVDTPAEARTHGAAMVLVDEAWNVAATRIYTEGDYSVRVGAAETEIRSNPLVNQLNEYLAQHPEPWAALSAAIAATVDAYHEDFSKRLDAIRPEASSRARSGGII